MPYYCNCQNRHWEAIYLPIRIFRNWRSRPPKPLIRHLSLVLPKMTLIFEDVDSVHHPVAPSFLMFFWGSWVISSLHTQETSHKFHKSPGCAMETGWKGPLCDLRHGRSYQTKGYKRIQKVHHVSNKQQNIIRFRLGKATVYLPTNTDKQYSDIILSNCTLTHGCGPLPEPMT